MGLAVTGGGSARAGGVSGEELITTGFPSNGLEAFTTRVAGGFDGVDPGEDDNGYVFGGPALERTTITDSDTAPAGVVTVNCMVISSDAGEYRTLPLWS